jgi:photosystem II stability/assembly factor-like uncharacterized protein
MKIRLKISIALILFPLFSCSSLKKIKSITSFETESIFKDAISIRAIEVLNDSLLFYAGSSAKYGLINFKTNEVKKFQLPAIHDSIYHEIRSIAFTKGKLFLLTIESPAQLYQMDYDATNLKLVYQEDNTKVFYDSMRFWNNKEGIAIGDPTETCMSVIITRDGGDTWQKVSCDDLPKTAVGEAAFAASNTNLAVYKDKVWMISGGKKSRIFTSNNKGLTWQVKELPIVQGGEMTGAFTIDFYKGKKGMILGGDWSKMEQNIKNKLISNDGGNSWNLVAEGEGVGYRSCVQVVPKTMGSFWLAVGVPGVSITTDFGRTWKDLSSKAYYTARFLNDSVVFVAGKNKIDKLILK